MYRDAFSSNVLVFEHAGKEIASIITAGGVWLPIPKPGSPIQLAAEGAEPAIWQATQKPPRYAYLGSSIVVVVDVIPG